jgi:hypothetical protein
MAGMALLQQQTATATGRQCAMHIRTTPENHRIDRLAVLWRLFPLLMAAALLFGFFNGIIGAVMTTEHRQCRK